MSFLFLVSIGAFVVAACAVAAAAALPAAVLADKQYRQRQQHKDDHNNDNTCHRGLPHTFCGPGSYQPEQSTH